MGVSPTKVFLFQIRGGGGSCVYFANKLDTLRLHVNVFCSLNKVNYFESLLGLWVLKYMNFLNSKYECCPLDLEKSICRSYVGLRSLYSKHISAMEGNITKFASVISTKYPIKIGRFVGKFPANCENNSNPRLRLETIRTAWKPNQEIEVSIKAIINSEFGVS